MLGVRSPNSQPEIKHFILQKGKEEVSAVTCLRQEKQGLTTTPCETYLRLQGVSERVREKVKEREVRLSMEGGESRGETGRTETWHMIINSRAECVSRG